MKQSPHSKAVLKPCSIKFTIVDLKLNEPRNKYELDPVHDNYRRTSKKKEEDEVNEIFRKMGAK